MKVWTRVLAGCALAGFVFALVMNSRRSPDPLAEGRLTSAWVSDLLSSDYNVRGKAQAALSTAGQSAVPQLLVLLERRDPFWDTYLASFSRFLPFAQPVKIDPALCRQRGAEMIARLGAKGAEAVPALIDSLAYDGAASEAERALLRVGDASLPHLVRALEQRNPKIRSRVARLLKEYVGSNEVSITPLIRALSDEDASVRREAALTLKEVCANAKVTRVLCGATKDSVPEVRAAAFEALAARTGHSAEVLEVVRSGLRDTFPVVRLEAAKALWAQTRDRDAVVPVLSGVLPSQEGWQAAYALGEIGPDAAEAVPALIEVLKTEKVARAFRTPPSSAVALGKIKEPAIPALTEVLSSPEPRVRLAAVLAFGYMGKAGRAAVPQLLNLLKDRNAEIRHVTAITLATIGAERELIVVGLSACLNAEDIYLRSAAAAHLREIAPERDWFVPAE